MTDTTTVVHVATGEIVDIDTADDDTLADTLHQLRQHATLVRRWQRAVEGELARRLADQPKGRVWLTGRYEIRRTWESVWDADELEGVIADLMSRGVLHRQTTAEIFKHPPVELSRTAANRLLERTTGDTHDQIAACRTWRAKGITVEASLPLIPDQD